MKWASIDIGTNTILLLVAEVEPARSVTGTPYRIAHVTEDHINFARLGQGVHHSRRFAKEAMERALQCFRAYRAICDRQKVERTFAVATSASRDSENSREFYTKVKAETGIDVQIIEGKTEARLSFRGGLLDGFDPGKCALLDIGGGSTEFVTQSDGTGDVHGQSLDVGCVRATELCLKGDPYTAASLDALREYLASQWNALDPKLQQELRDKEWIGIAGTPTTLAALELKMTQFIPAKVDGCKLSLARLKFWLDQLSKQTQKERAAHPLMGTGRGDVMVAGTAILVSAMEYFGKGEVVVSSRGLRHGVLLDPPA